MLALQNPVYSAGIWDLGFVDSNAVFEWVDDAPFSHFAVDGVDFVGVDEAGFHDEESAYLFRYAEFGGGWCREVRDRGEWMSQELVQILLRLREWRVRVQIRSKGIRSEKLFSHALTWIMEYSSQKLLY